MTINFPNRQHKAILKQLLQAGLVAADPAVAIAQHCKIIGDTLRIGRRQYHLPKYERIVPIGVGKASTGMAIALHQLLGKQLDGGLLVVKDPPKRLLKNFEVYKAGHPTPDLGSYQAAKNIQRFLKSLTIQDLLIVLISGGASSLLTAPAHGLTLKDKQRTTNLLLRSGATIQEMNAVRKHLSAIKGGQLVAASSATIISLILSDVIGNDISTIGSGPTAPDPTTFRQSRQILVQRDLWNSIPSAVKRHIQQGMRGIVAETLKPEDPQFKRVHNVIIGDNKLAVKHIAQKAQELGFRPYIQTATLQGEAEEIGRLIGSLARDIEGNKKRIRRPACLIWGGEPTVTVKGRGKGGRAQECALSAAIGMAGLPNMIMAGLGTDGSDGPTDVAGAVVNGNTVRQARAKGINPDKALRAHDSYACFQQIGGHIKTGPTGTNVNDIYLLLAL